MIQQNVLHPSAAALPDQLRPVIEEFRSESESQRRLAEPVVAAMRRAGAFRISTPRELGGFELPLADSFALYEALGAIDAPAAWNVWNGNLGFAAAMLAPEAVDAIWGGPHDPITANSARVGGLAVARPGGGYALSGRWDIVSAIDIADWVALFAIGSDGDGPRVVNGMPDVRVCFVPVDAIAVHDTWHTNGMRATGSNTVVADRCFVPEAFTISPFAPAHIDRALYRIPAFTIASWGAAPIVVGAAQAALDELVVLAATKATDNGQSLGQRAHVHSAFGGASIALHSARLVLRDAAEQIDRTADAGGEITVALRARLRAAMSHATDVSREVLSTVQRLASSSAIYAANPIERIVRDGTVAAQHGILASTHVEIAGRLAFGLDAGTPVV